MEKKYKKNFWIYQGLQHIIHLIIYQKIKDIWYIKNNKIIKLLNNYIILQYSIVPRRGKNAFINKYENENEEYKKKLENNEQLHGFDPLPIYSIGKEDPPMYSFSREERFKAEKYT